MRFVLAACSALLASASPVLAAEAAPNAVSVPVTDAARLAAARQTVDYVFPLGTYGRIMNGTMDKMMDSIMDSMMQLPLKDLAGISGVDTSQLGSGTMAQIMEIYDPAFKQRMQVSTRTMMTDMMGLMTQFEPDIRDGLASAYAGRFDTKQLQEMNAFFATPTGRAYAADSYIIMMSPEVMNKMQALMPRLMKEMPAIVEKVKASTANLPAPRKYAELKSAEKDKLAGLLGISRKELDEGEAKKAAQ
ncbi:DUF2059 domain-containing protein [Novosphingobium guangzhouense]|uniref:DUF2059 domain-containing protein n=1 Tax=Novosphingobium guangzhouense TaxID=1850347 RepID=A0A2K2FTT5_9SPHN|nr:DUF2059 domain-containing protein [Novosphingobium guangzhouense]PNU02186.1 hypothetical protein A8V01_09945 [Novosphingobium guangzhouense]